MKKILISLAAICMMGLSACTGTEGPKQQIGTLMGAAAGAIIGSNIGGGDGRTAAIAIGTLAGAWAGSEVGKSLDKADRLYAAQATQDALENNRSGEAEAWSNPDSGNSGTITPQEAVVTDSGQPCREYQQTVMINGKEESAYGTACREADGSWRITNS